LLFNVHLLGPPVPKKATCESAIIQDKWRMLAVQAEAVGLRGGPPGEEKSRAWTRTGPQGSRTGPTNGPPGFAPPVAVPRGYPSFRSCPERKYIICVHLRVSIRDSPLSPALSPALSPTLSPLFPLILLSPLLFLLPSSCKQQQQQQQQQQLVHKHVLVHMHTYLDFARIL